MAKFLENKYVLWIAALACVAFLQAVAISRDRMMSSHKAPALSFTEDFVINARKLQNQIAKAPRERGNAARLVPVSMVGSLSRPDRAQKPLSAQRMQIPEEGVFAKAGEDLEKEFESVRKELISEVGEVIDEGLLQDSDVEEQAMVSATAKRASAKPRIQAASKKVLTPVKKKSGNGLRTEDNYIVHTVKRGETLSQIAKMYDMTVSQLVLYNGIMNPDHIYPGYQLQIAFQKTFQHEVKERETLWSISRTYGIGVKKIKEVNQLSSNALHVGQAITLEIEDLSEKGLQRFISARKRKSRFIWPLQGRTTDEYGWRVHPINKKRLFHKGLDIAAPRGKEIMAADSGTVLFAGKSGGYGNLVILSHPQGYTTRYGHCQKLTVKTGQKIEQGDTIALVGSTGISTGPHLHFEIRKKGRAMNPRDYL